MTGSYIGIMSGTSLDGIDIALVDFEGERKVNIVNAETLAFPEHLHTPLSEIANGAPCDLPMLGKLDHQLGEHYAQVTIDFMQRCGVHARDIRAIGCHGQNIYHSPDSDYPFTLQIGDANRIVARTGITTVADFRRRDVALKGQGAPLAPGFHAAYFSHPEEARVALNLGGIANITLLHPDKPVIGFDTGPASTLLDIWYRRHHNDSFDAAGQWSKTGAINKEFLNEMLADPYFARPHPKSTGREYFNSNWLDQHLTGFDAAMKAEDVQATLTELSVITVANAIKGLADINTCIVCGGGAHNDYLLSRLQQALPSASVKIADDFGVACDFVEAAAFAWLARRALNGLAGNIPSVTGAKEATVLGAIYPAN